MVKHCIVALSLLQVQMLEQVQVQTLQMHVVVAYVQMLMVAWW